MTMYDTQRPAARPVAQADNLAITAFILAFFIPLVGLIMGVVSRRQAKRAGMRPSALSTWAVWLGGIFTAITVVVMVVLAAGVGAAVNSVNTTDTHRACWPGCGQPVNPVVPAVNTAPALTHHDVTRVVFRVTGTAASGADITYGSDSDNRSPGGTLGILGSGTALPWHASLPYHSSALYYDVSAQLQGDGNITCTLSIKVTRHYSDGTHSSRSEVVQRGHASGQYNICDAQAS